MGQVIDMGEARKRLRPEEEEEGFIQFFDEFCSAPPDMAAAIEALLKTREEEFIAMWYNLPTNDLDDKQ